MGFSVFPGVALALCPERSAMLTYRASGQIGVSSSEMKNQSSSQSMSKQ
jgi:hypothetical protein